MLQVIIAVQSGRRSAAPVMIKSDVRRVGQRVFIGSIEI
jgi:hypothetical protein